MLQAARLENDPKVRVHLDCRVHVIGFGHLVVDGPQGRETILTSGPVLVSHGVRPDKGVVAGLRATVPGPPVHLAGEAAGAGGSMHAALRSAASAAAELLDGIR